MVYIRLIFCPFLKNSRPPPKKLKPTFCRKLNVMEATYDVAKKNSRNFQRYSIKIRPSELSYGIPLYNKSGPMGAMGDLFLE